MRGRTLAPLGLVALVTSVTLVVSGCAKKDHTESPGAEQPATTASPSASASAAPGAIHPAGEADILAAYTGMWMAMAVANETGDSTNPELKRYADGDALKQVVTAIIANRESGVITKGRPFLTPAVTNAQPSLDKPTQATVTDCADSSNWLRYHKSDGTLVDNVPGGRRHIVAQVHLAAGSWKVSSFELGKVGSC